MKQQSSLLLSLGRKNDEKEMREQQLQCNREKESRWEQKKKQQWRRSFWFNAIFFMANLYAFVVTRFQFSLSMTLSFPQCIAFLTKLITMIGDYFRWLKCHRVQGRDDCEGLSHIQHSLPHCEHLENRGHHFNRNKQPPQFFYCRWWGTLPLQMIKSFF